MKYSACKEIDVLIKTLVRDGWEFHRGSKHGKLHIPSGKRTLIVPSSPSDYRAYLNFKLAARRLILSAV